MSVQRAKIAPTDAPAGERFFQALRDLRDPELLRQLDCTITELTTAVMETGGKGHLTLKVAVTAVEVAADGEEPVKVKIN